MENAFTFNLNPEGIGQLIFDLKDAKVNVLSAPVLKELEQLCDELATHKDVKVLLITSGKEHSFIAGADLKEFENVFKQPELADEALERGHRVFKKLASLPFPTIAAIDGICVGGGLELALACAYRIVSDHPKTSLGLPETQIGIMPGWGGTQRLPRLIGLRSGLEMILTGKTVNAVKAYKMKLADAIFAWEFFPEKALAFAKSLLTGDTGKKLVKRRKQSGMAAFLLEKNPLGRELVYYKSKKQVLEKTKGFYPAPLVALETIKKSYPLSLKKGLEVEKKMFLENAPKAFANSDNLIKVFFQNEALKKDAGQAEKASPLPVHNAGVLGAGTMGGGLIFLFSYHDIPVRFKDINWEAVGKGYGHVHSLYKKMVELRKLNKDQSTLKFQSVSGTIDYSGFQQADLVIEAATENLDLKKTLLKELEKVVKPTTIIATNTSSLTVAELASALEYPERFVGMHFFNPPNRMPLVEVVKGPQTSPEAIATAVDVCRKLGRTPLVVGDCHGFLVNRIFVIGANEMLRFLEEGATMSQVDKAFLDFGMPMAPFKLSDEVGNDVACKVSHIFEKDYGERMKAPQLLEEMDQKALYGKKVGKGFYLYEGKKETENPEVLKLIEGLKKGSTPPTQEEMIERAIYLMVNEASRCLDEHIAASPAHVDMALILGTGFPPFRGGLLRYADAKGIPHIVERLKDFEQKFGSRYAPSKLLIQMAEQNKGFY